MVFYTHEQKAKKLITYSIDNAPTIGSGISFFNEVADTIKQNTYEESRILLDTNING